MDVKSYLRERVLVLEEAGIATARLDCLVLLEDTTKKDRSWLLAHPEFEISATTLRKLGVSLGRRANHEPLAYIRGKSEFYGRGFAVNEHTLEPRPETEAMLTLLRELANSRQLTANSRKATIIDIGTGSGCIAITAKLEMPELTVIATDIDKKCIETASKNAKNLGASVKFYHGNLLQPLPSSIFHLPSSRLAILANLPYVPDKYQLNEAAKFEPKHAIFGGPDGLDLYRELFLQIAKNLQFDSGEPRFVLTESLPFQHEELEKIAGSAGYRLLKTDDFIQVFSPA